MKKELPLFIRIWICFSAPKRWRKRMKIDAAVLSLKNNPENQQEEELAWMLKDLSDKLWEQEFSRYNKEKN